MKNFNRFFALFTLILGVMFSGCVMNVDDSTSEDDSAAPSGYTQVVNTDGGNVSGLYFRETVSDTNLVYKFSMAPTSYLRYLPSDTGTGSEFDSSRSSFKNLPNTDSSRATKTTEVFSKRYLLVAYWDNYDERSNWDKASLVIMTVTNWVLKSGYTQAQTWDGASMTMGYKLVSGSSNVTFVSDFETGGRLLYELDSTSRQILASDIADSNPDFADYTAGANGIDAGTNLYVNFAYWPAANNATSIAALDWSVAKKGWVKVNYNSSEVPFLTIAGVRQYGSSISTSEGTQIVITATVSNAPVYVIWRSGSAVTVPTETEWNSASNQVGTYPLTINYSGNSLFTVFARTKESGKTWSSNAQWSFTPGTTNTTVSVQSISLSYNTMNLVVGGSGTLVTTFNPSNATNQNANYVSSSPSVASVSSSGVVNALTAGTTTITVTAQDVTNGVKTATCTVVVTSSGGTTTTEKYFYISSTWAGQQAKITFENGGGTSGTYTIGSDGKIPVVISGTPKLTVSITANGQWCDAAGNANTYSQCQSSDWSGDSVLFTSYTNGTFNPTGRTTTWTRR